jgi:hypothetical protein
MKIKCLCGNLIVDQTDELPTKAHYISDRHWFQFLESIDDAIEKSGPSPQEKEKACNNVRKTNSFRSMWQCSECGRIFIDDKNYQLHIFKPESVETNKEIFSE